MSTPNPTPDPAAAHRARHAQVLAAMRLAQDPDRYLALVRPPSTASSTDTGSARPTRAPDEPAQSTASRPADPAPNAAAAAAGGGGGRRQLSTRV